VQGIEVDDAINAEDHRLAVDLGLPMAVIVRRLDDPAATDNCSLAAVATFAEYDSDNR
jgi:hypothetical protein